MPITEQHEVNEEGLSGGDGGGLKLSKGTPAVPFKVEDLYKPVSTNWYKTFPYGFRFTPRNGNNPVTFFLPINPTDISVATRFATNIVTTLYGVVEEHSEVRYYDMTISGTTGFAPRYINAQYQSHGMYDLKDETSGKWKSSGRLTYDRASIGLGGALPQLTNLISQTKDNFSDLAGAFGDGKPDNGLHVDKTGYAAFHNFYRFLLAYKKDTSGQNGFKDRGSKHPMTWLNYKDHNKYDCIITGFNLNRSAQNPFLYNYSITMRCFNLRDIDAADPDVSDLSKFGLGFNGIDSVPGFAAIGNAVGSAAGLLNSAAGFF